MNCLAEVIGPDFRTSARDIHVLNHRAIALVHNKHYAVLDGLELTLQT